MEFYTSVEARGSKILYRGYKNGIRVKQVIPYKPTLYVPSPTKTDYKTIDGEYVAPIDFDSMPDAKNYIKQYKDVDNFKIYGMEKFEYAYIANKFKDHIEWSMDHINIMLLDIEVSSSGGFPDISTANKEVTAITIKTPKEFVTLGLKPFDDSKSEAKYVHCVNEADLLKRFMAIWVGNYPDIVTGWNIKFFDIPYLVRRVELVLGEAVSKMISPWKLIDQRTVTLMAKEQTAFYPRGVAILDYLELYRKFAPHGASQESYKLDSICEFELDEKKLSYAEYGSLDNLYQQNHQLYIEYNIHDVKLIELLDNKLKLLDLALTLAYDNKCNLEDVFTQVRMWDVIIYNHLNKKNIVIPQRIHTSKNEAYIGAYVKHPIVGMHKWVMSFDLTSLYPHLIMQYNISPDTFIKYENFTPGLTDFRQTHANILDDMVECKVDLSILKQEGVTMTPNRVFFSKNKQGFLSELMQEMYDGRAIYKKKMIAAKKEYEVNHSKETKNLVSRYDNLQLAKKVSLNSAYGALGNEWFRFFDVRQASAITTAGQLAIRWIERKMNEYLNKLLKTEGVDYIIAVDTDSIYVSFEKLVETLCQGMDTEKIVNFLDSIAEKKIQPYIDKCYQELADYTNAFAQKMFMKREVIADRAIWTAKKRYFMSVWDSEGVRYAKPEMKVMGIEVVRSSTPAVVRKRLKEALWIFLKDDNETLISYINTFRNEFSKLPPESVAFPRGVTNLTKWVDRGQLQYKSGTPIHVRGSILYNNMIKQHKMENLLEPIRDGDKIKFIQLVEPNPLFDDVISFPDVLPEIFDLHKYIDYNKQFETSFINPLETITDVIGWHTKKQTALF